MLRIFASCGICFDILFTIVEFILQIFENVFDEFSSEKLDL